MSESSAVFFLRDFYSICLVCGQDTDTMDKLALNFWVSLNHSQSNTEHRGVDFNFMLFGGGKDNGNANASNDYYQTMKAPHGQVKCSTLAA